MGCPRKSCEVVSGSTPSFPHRVESERLWWLVVPRAGLWRHFLSAQLMGSMSVLSLATPNVRKEEAQVDLDHGGPRNAQ